MNERVSSLRDRDSVGDGDDNGRGKAEWSASSANRASIARSVKPFLAERQTRAFTACACALALASPVAAFPRPARAQVPVQLSSGLQPLGRDANFGAATDSARALELEAILDHDAATIRPWFFGWVTFATGLMGANLAVNFVATDPEQRSDARVQFVAGGIGLAALVMTFPPSIFPLAPRGVRGQTASEAHARRLYLEARLTRAAETQRLTRSAISHLGGVALAAGAGLYLALVDGHAPSGALVAAGTLIANELQIATQPMVAMDAVGLSAREAGGAGASGVPRRHAAAGPQWFVRPQIGGLGCSVLRQSYGLAVIGIF